VFEAEQRRTLPLYTALLGVNSVSRHASLTSTCCIFGITDGECQQEQGTDTQLLD